MSRRVVSYINSAGEYVNCENEEREASAKALPKFGEGSDYFKGAKPSDLAKLDNRQLFMSANRIYTTLSENRGTKKEINHAAEAYSAVVREARSRRATLHD